MRDVTLYYCLEHGAHTTPTCWGCGDTLEASPAVLGVTVAEIEEAFFDARAALPEAQERFQRAERERDEARDEADAAETWWRKRTGHYRPALEQITARYIAGASAGELADIAFEALRGRDK